jgi:hypothetical protein
MHFLRIRSGGQSGVDRAALDYAVRHNLQYVGWCPRGGWAEDFTTPPGLLVRFPHMIETPSAETWQRTAWNVRDSHATLILLRGENIKSEGTLFTRRCAELVFMRPCLVVQLGEHSNSQTVNRWLAQVRGTFNDDDFVLNIAGPRESEAPGIYDDASTLLESLPLP